MLGMIRTTAAAVLAAGALGAGSAAAAVQVYLDQTAFLSAAGPSPQVETFTNPPPLNAGLSISGINVQFPGDVMKDAVGRTPADDPLGTNATTTFSFASAITAFGGDFNLEAGGVGTGIKVTISLASGDVVVGEVPAKNPAGTTWFTGFWGFTSSDPFTSVVFSTGSNTVIPGEDFTPVREAYTLDNLTYGRSGGSTPVPEPASLALLGLGLAGLVAARRRRETA